MVRSSVALKVDTGRTIALDCIAYNRVVGRIVVVNAMIAITIAQVAHNYVIAGRHIAGIHI